VTVNEFEQAQAAVKKPGVAGWWTRIDELPDDQRQSLAQAAASTNISHRAIATVLTGWGIPVSVAQVGHWRRNHVG
jgi:hypothetical protein